MNLKNCFSGRAAGWYLALAGGVLALISIVFYAVYGAAAGERNLLIYLPLAAVVVLEVLSLFWENDWLIALAPALGMIALCAFVVDSVYTFVGYFFNLAMFGDVSMMGSIVRLCVLMGAAVLLLLVSAYLRHRKTA